MLQDGMYISKSHPIKDLNIKKRVDIETARKDVSQWQKQLQGLLHTNQMFEFPTSLTSSYILDLRNESPS